MKMTAYGIWGATAFLTWITNVGSMHMGVDNVFSLGLVGHDIASRIASRKTLWIPTIETRDFPDHDLQRDDFMIYWRQLAFRNSHLS